MLAGGATTTVYPSTNETDVVYILSDSHTRFVFAEDDSQVEKVRESRDQLTDIEKIIIFDGAGDGDWVITMDDLRALGADFLAKNPDAVTERAAVGSVRQPGHADLHLRNDGQAQGRGTDARQLDLRGCLRRKRRTSSTHQRRAVPLAAAGALVRQGPDGGCSCRSASSPRSTAGCRRSWTTCRSSSRRSWQLCPRIFEKVYAGSRRQPLSEGGAKAKIFTWAFKVGNEAAEKEVAGEKVGGTLGIQAQHGRQVGVLQGARAPRRQHPLHHLRLRGPVQGHRHLVLHRGTARSSRATV